jgi:hypothetical protein
MSYDPEVESKGIEPLTSSMLRMRSTPNSFRLVLKPTIKVLYV